MTVIWPINQTDCFLFVGIFNNRPMISKSFFKQNILLNSANNISVRVCLYATVNTQVLGQLSVRVCVYTPVHPRVLGQLSVRVCVYTPVHPRVLWQLSVRVCIQTSASSGTRTALSMCVLIRNSAYSGTMASFMYVCAYTHQQILRYWGIF